MDTTKNSPIDPTRLTTEQLYREIAALKEMVFTRLDGMDKAVSLFKDDITRVPTVLDKEIEHLKEKVMERFDQSDKRFDGVMRQSVELVNEKFSGVQTQFKERDTRVEQTAKDTKIAVDAALQAAKELYGKQNEAFSASIAKSESATSKQIDQQGQLIITSTGALNDKVTDLKDRLTGIENRTLGNKAQHDEGRSNIGVILGVVSIVISVGFLIIALMRIKP